MGTATVTEVTPGPEVCEFVKKHQAESAFLKICALVRECFPHLLEMKFRLREDPDVEDREWCVIDIWLPLIESVDERVARWQRYHGRLIEEIPLVYLPFFNLSKTYAGL